jgi:hypothetical protein
VDADAAWDFIEGNYPQPQNISKRAYKASDKDKGVPYLEISLLHGHVAEILSSIPDNKTYWQFEQAGLGSHSRRMMREQSQGSNRRPAARVRARAMDLQQRLLALTSAYRRGRA